MAAMTMTKATIAVVGPTSFGGGFDTTVIRFSRLATRVSVIYADGDVKRPEAALAGRR